MLNILVIMLFLPTFLATPLIRHSKIIGAATASRGSHPYQVAMLKWNQMYCGGSIIHAQWVLTAAHCDVDDPANFKFVAGTQNYKNIGNSGQTRSLTEFHPHPKYEEGKYNFDVALIKVNQPFVINSILEPVKLNTNHAYPTGKVIVSGWGYTAGFDPDSIPDLLQTATLDVSTHLDCKHKWIGKIKFLELCLVEQDEKEQVVCDDDIGGTAVVKENGEYVLYGVVNLSSKKCAARGEPGSFLSISEFLDWIRETMK